MSAVALPPSAPSADPAGAEVGAPRALARDPLTERLLAASVELFTERGFEKAGVAAIARRAGVTTGAIYSRWSGKHDMLLDALDVVMSEQLDALLSADASMSAADILSSLGAELLKRPAAADALFAEALVTSRRDPEFAEMLHRRIAEQETRFALLIDDGKLAGLIDPTLDTDAIVALCHAISVGFAMFGSVNRPLPGADGWNTVVERLIAAALPPTPDPPEEGQP